MIYSSIHNEKVKELKKLNIKKERDNKEVFLVEGEHLVIEAFKSGFLKEVIILENYDININVAKITVTEKVMKYISALDNPPKIIGICNKHLNKEIGNKILILEDIQDPGNLGTIIRSSVAFGVDTIIMSKNTVDLYNSKVIRASQGMLFYMNFIIDDLEKCITYLKNNCYKIIATKVNGGKSLKNVENIKKIAIIMGNEGNGVSQKLIELSDEFLYIDMNSNCESLNVAVATSIILYELSK